MKATQSIFIFFFVLLYGAAQSQDIPQNPNQTDIKDKRQGKWTIFYDAEWSIINEADKAEFYRLIEYKDDKPIGTVKDHYKNGVVQMEAMLLADRPQEIMDGLATFYRPDKSKEKTQFFEKGVLKEEKLFALDGRPLKEDWKTIDSLGMVYYKKRDYSNAYGVFDKAKVQAEKEFGKQHQNYALSLKRLADLLTDVAQYAQAEAFYLESIKIQKETMGDKDSTYSGIINNLGILYYYTGNFTKAESLWVEALNIIKASIGEENARYVGALSNLGVLYYDKGDYKKAEEYYNIALEVRERLLGKKNTDYAESLTHLGNVFNEKGQYQKASTYFKEATEIFKEKDNDFYPKSLYNLAMVYKRLGNYAESERLYKEVIELHKIQVGTKHPDYAKSLMNLSIAYREKYQFEEAITLCLESMEIQKELLGEKHYQYAHSLGNLGMVYYSMGDYIQAETIYKKSANLLKEALGENHPMYVDALMRLSALYLEKQETANSESLLLEALAILKNTTGENTRKYAGYTSNLGVFYFDKGNYPKAKVNYQKALEIRERMLGKQSLDYAQSLTTLANLYRVEKEYTKSEEYYLEAIDIYQKIGLEEHVDYASLLFNSGLLYVLGEEKDVAKYVALSEQSFDILKRTIGENNAIYATNLFVFVLNLPSEYLLNNPKIEKRLLDAVQITKEILGEKNIIYGLGKITLGRFHKLNGELIKANEADVESSQIFIDLIDRDFPSLSQTGKELFVKRFEVYFNQYAQATTFAFITQNLNYSGWLYDNVLATKGLLFNTQDKTRERILASDDEVLIKLYQDWQSKRTLLADIYQLSIEEKQKKEINEQVLQEEVELIEKQLSQKSQRFATSLDCKRYSWKDIQQQLKKDEAAIEIIRVYESDSIYYMALIITPQTKKAPNIIILQNGNELEGKYNKYYHNSIKANKEDKYSYQQYWASIQSQLKGIKKVYLSPDGVYNQINLLTLQNPESKQYLADIIDIQVLNNTKELVTPKKPTRSIKEGILIGFPNYNDDSIESDTLDKKKERILEAAPLLALGQDTTLRFFDGQNISPLPGTKIEVQNLENIFKNAQIEVKTYLEEKATEKAIKQLENPYILHIATHGFFLQNITQSGRFMGIEDAKFTENPLLRSGLLLSGAKQAMSEGGDGVLTAYEAMSLNLDDTELVVLSACETGLGEIVNGEGVYGLKRAFMVAGAKTILMSLWTVSDAATQELMTLFYQNWITEKQPKREAFKNAQKELRKKYPEPNYWGAFVMIGE